MISVTIYKNQGNQITGFRFLGHAEFADPGEDIVCAGVSVLCVNTINSIEQFTDSAFKCEVEEESGNVMFELEEPASGDTELLIQSMILGLKGIIKDYGNEYIVLNFKEV